MNAIVSPRFKRARPAALGKAYNGASIGGVIFSPVWVALIERFGFPASALAVGLVTVVSIGALALGPLRRTPAIFGLVRQMMGDAAVFALAVGVQCAAVAAYLAGRGAVDRRTAPRDTGA